MKINLSYLQEKHLFLILRFVIVQISYDFVSEKSFKPNTEFRITSSFSYTHRRHYAWHSRCNIQLHKFLSPDNLVYLY